MWCDLFRIWGGWVIIGSVFGEGHGCDDYDNDAAAAAAASKRVLLRTTGSGGECAVVQEVGCRSSLQTSDLRTVATVELFSLLSNVKYLLSNSMCSGIFTSNTIRRGIVNL